MMCSRWDRWKWKLDILLILIGINVIGFFQPLSPGLTQASFHSCLFICLSICWAAASQLQENNMTRKSILAFISHLCIQWRVLISFYFCGHWTFESQFVRVKTFSIVNFRLRVRLFIVLHHRRKRGGRISDGRADRTLFTVPLLQISPIWCQSRVASRWGCRQFEAGKRNFMKNSFLYFYLQNLVPFCTSMNFHNQDQLPWALFTFRSIQQWEEMKKVT